MRKPHKIAIFSAILICLSPLAAQDYAIDYFGVVSTVLDSNMSRMTSDLYYTQLNEISQFSVTDRRSDQFLREVPGEDDFDSGKLSFFTEIKKEDSSAKWLATFRVYDKAKQQEASETKEYDSFYKILMEPKTSLQQTIKSLVENGTSAQKKELPATRAAPQAAVSTEFLSGTWYGEEFIDKIVIMRGGRGFVIFNNGASMNITVSVSSAGQKTTVTVRQNGRTNASYFPDIPRSIALQAAVDAEPIEWIFEVADENTLMGKKNTLVATNNSAAKASLDVTWQRKLY